jgi:hypothetical protein
MGINGRAQNTLKIELPKLLFGNNFDELQYKDFAPLVQKLINYNTPASFNASTASG